MAKFNPRQGEKITNYKIDVMGVSALSLDLSPMAKDRKR